MEKVVSSGGIALLEQGLAAALGRPGEGRPEGSLGEADFLVALGGDGTVLAANRVAAAHGTPILGVHLGGPASFGFLTETVPQSAGAVLEAILAGQGRVEPRMMVGGEVRRSGKPVGEYAALNELVLRAQSRMMRLAVTVGDTFIATYAADGIIVATPTGSTAYNLAAGGPLVHPSIDAMVVTPICPHTLNVRSLLADPDVPVTVVLESGERDVSLLTADGQVSLQLEKGDEVRFVRSTQVGRFLTLDGGNFYRKVQTRLRLGERFGS